MPATLTVISEATTARLATMGDAVEACRIALSDLAGGVASLSNPAAMFLSGPQETDTHFKVKGGSVPTLRALGFRMIGDVGRDGAGGEHHWCYMLDPTTARPLALVAQTHIHRLRTAASGLLAARLLSGVAAPRVALIGAGRIGTCLAAGFREVFPDGRLTVASRRLSSATAAADAAGEGVTAASIPEAVADADVVIALSTADEPVLDPLAFRPGMTVIGMGENHELPAALLAAADRFVVDDLGYATTLGSISAWVRRGETTPDALQARLSASLGEVLADPARGRRTATERVLAVVQGLAIADLALAEICRRRAESAGAGRSVSLD
ncbi:NAD(P)-binding domain-containing protein [Acuticoccus mangrovi]|uniref:NAD(P)-binding domain-containing protein n=1 Tax=Acuticoccus mangrovi TaxID=2796142 RepID=A0A934IUS0_9HYPH|nr:NAD(P)-binding domain-containing protein [Acuticoccus mangrovi]MBJ3778522.1 NAD(P)-binding domain-containing protein [Acuticoccus mangrovi]